MRNQKQPLCNNIDSTFLLYENVRERGDVYTTWIYLFEAVSLYNKNTQFLSNVNSRVTVYGLQLWIQARCDGERKSLAERVRVGVSVLVLGVYGRGLALFIMQIVQSLTIWDGVAHLGVNISVFNFNLSLVSLSHSGLQLSMDCSLLWIKYSYLDWLHCNISVREHQSHQSLRKRIVWGKRIWVSLYTKPPTNITLHSKKTG